jgi:hypothetical protein
MNNNDNSINSIGSNDNNNINKQNIAGTNFMNNTLT